MELERSQCHGVSRYTAGRLKMLFVAEVGLNHNGNFGLIPELVRQAARAGADIAKFQLGWRGAEGEINHIDAPILADILRTCEHYGIEPMFSVFTRQALDLLRPTNPRRYKIASRTVVDDPSLARAILEEGKETFVSLRFWNEEAMLFGEPENVRYLFCRSLYPCPPEEVVGMPKDFRTSPYAGYSDHTVGIETALLAVARGASVIEKHFTPDKSDVTVRDHALSATPEEFAELVWLGRNIARSLALGV